MYEQTESFGFKPVTKGAPCPICGKTDWCMAAADAAICGRIDIPPSGWKQIKIAKDGRPIYKLESASEDRNPKIISKTKKRKPAAPIPTIKLTELPADREPSPQPTESELLTKPKKASDDAHSFEDIIYSYASDQWVTRTQWVEPRHPKGRDKIYYQWHRYNGKAIAKKGDKVWPAYRIEEATAALSKADNGNTVIWVEGEPNVETLRLAGLASTTLMGSGWQDLAIEDALFSFIHENQTPVIIDLIESDKPGLTKKDKLEKICAERSIPYVRLFPTDLWPENEKPVEVPAESVDVTDIINAIGVEEFRRRLEERLSQAAVTSDASDDGAADSGDEDQPTQIFHSKLNRKRLQIERGLGHRLEYNKFKQRIELDGDPICDWLEDQGGAKVFIAEHLDIDVGDTDAIAILNRVAKKRPYHPIQDYLNDCYKKHGDDTSILGGIALRYLGTMEPIHQAYMIKHLIGSVKRVFEPGCQHDTMLIFKSEQGMKKSKFFKTLYGEGNFTDSVQGTEEKDALMTLSLNWACEYAEFESITTKKEISALKSWLTRHNDDYRKPYARTVRSHPRTFVLVGSTNKDDFLKDETGERRFMVIPVLLPEIPIEKLAQERDRIWGAAMALYKAGHTNFLSKSERKIQDSSNEDFRQIDPWEEIIAGFLTEDKDFTSTREILDKALFMEPRQMDSQSSRRVNSAMTRLGWKKQRRRHLGTQEWGWARMVESVVPDVVPDRDQHPAQAPTRCLQGFEASVPDVPVKNSSEFSYYSAQQELNNFCADISDKYSTLTATAASASVPKNEKINCENLPAHPAQRVETLAKNESEPVPDVVPDAIEFTGTTDTAARFEVGTRVRITLSLCRWAGELGRVKEVQKDGWYVVVTDGGNRAALREQEFEIFAEPKQLAIDNLFSPQQIFEILKVGQTIKALPHKDHTMIRRSVKAKVGEVTGKRQRDGKFYALVETEAGLKVYNLEAVDINI